MKTRIFLVALCCIAMGQPWGPASEPGKDKAIKPIVVPFEILKSGHMAISIKVNGKGPYKVIFDTGAPISLLNNKVAKEAGLLKDSGKPAFALFGTMGQVKIKSLEVGDVKAEQVNTIIMDHPTVSAISKALGPIEGIVGFPFFARFKMTLDYKNKELTFVPNDYKPGDVMETLMLTIMASSSRDKNPKPKVLASAGLWGMSIENKSLPLEKKDKESGKENKETPQEDAPGMVIEKVFAESAASAAGLKKGDRILKIDGRWTDSLPDLYEAVGLVKPGTKVPVVIQRDNKEIEVKVQPKAGL
jgi:membrane-associated protease RseP (regulator of RpoE activity)